MSLRNIKMAPYIDEISLILRLWHNKIYIKISRNRRCIQLKIGVLLQKDFHHIVYRKFQGPQTFRIDDAIISSLMIECSYAPKLLIKICTVKRFAEVYYNKIYKKQGVWKYLIFNLPYESPILSQLLDLISPPEINISEPRFESYDPWDMANWPATVL